MVKTTKKTDVKAATAVAATAPTEKTTASKKVQAKKTVAKKTVAKKAVAKKAVVKPAVAKKVVAKQAVAKKVVAKPATVKKEVVETVPTTSQSAGVVGQTIATPSITADERQQMIAEAAYLRGESRGFMSDEREDWLAAEAEVDMRLASAGIDVRG